MRTTALHRNRLAEYLSSLTVDDMAWAMKFLTDRLSSRLKNEETISETIADAERDKTAAFLSDVCGKWVDDKDADEMVKEIYASRNTD